VAQAYVLKAAREGRRRTCWRRPDDAYEAALARWLDGVFRDRELLDDIARLAAHVRPLGDANALAQTLVKLVAPGAPDIYQGCEIRDDSLVDPDNRRPVDYAARRALLASSPTSARAPTSTRASCGRSAAPRAAPQAPRAVDRRVPAVLARGPHADHVFAFARGEALAAIVPRLTASAEGWRDTTIELPGRWREVLSDRKYEQAIAIASCSRPFRSPCSSARRSGSRLDRGFWHRG